MSLQSINSYLASKGYDPNATVADARTKASEQALNVKAAPKQDFFGNVANSVSKIPGAIVHSIVDSAVGQNSAFRSFQQVGKSNSLTKQANSKIDVYGKKLSDLKQQFHTGKLDAKGYSAALKKLSSSQGEVDKLNKDAAEQAKQARANLGTKFVNTAALVGMAAGGVAGAAGKTGLSELGTAAVDNAYSGGWKAFGKGVLGEIGGIKPLAGESAGGIVKGLTGAVGGALDSQALASTVNEARRGKVDPLNIALTASSVLPGGVLKAGGAAVNKVGDFASKAVYDTHGVYDVIKLKGGATVNEGLNALKEASPKKFAAIEKKLKVAQDLAFQEHGKDPKALATLLAANQGSGTQFADMTLKDFVGGIDKMVSERRRFQALATKAGLKVPEGLGVVAARMTTDDKKIIAGRLAAAVNPTKELELLKKEGLVKSKTLYSQLEDMVKTKATGKELSKQVSKLASVTPQMIDGKEARAGGYVLGLAKGAGTIRRSNQVGEIVRGTKAPLGAIGRTLEKIGLSTQESSPELQKSLFTKVSNTFTKAVDDSPVGMSGKDVLKELNALAEKKTGVTDIRQLKFSEVAQEFKGQLNDTEVKQVLKAYKDSFSVLSTGERGLAGKITDLNMKYNPIAAPYSRAQGTFRYEKNKFFRVQENIETKAGTALLTKGVAKPGEDYSAIRGAMHDTGFLKNAGMGGQSANEFGGVTAKLSLSQENDIAAGFKALGVKDTASMEKFLANPKNSGLAQDLKAVVQYPDKGFTSSNFMKAMNLAVFPTRYNLKVTSLAAKALAKENGVRQMSVLKGLNDFHNWSKTPEGIKWQSKNSELLGIIHYFTPIGSVETVLGALGARNIRDLGTIGGLPFGVISGVLQGQGAIRTDSPYLNPKTGEVVPEKIPKDLKARASQALVDILGTMFTYPGRQIGITSKKQLVQGAVDNVPGLKGGKYDSVTRTDLTAEQKRTQAVLRAGQAKTNLAPPTQTKNKTVNLTSSKPVTITPIYKASKPKRAKVRAIPVGRF